MKRILLVATLSLAWGCGGDSGPTGPDRVPPTITTANTMVYIGQTLQFQATGGGTIRWGGDAPGVATIDQTTGLVTGVGNGRVTIWAENEGGRTTRLLRGLPSFAGSWVGNYTIQNCQSSVVFAQLNFCGTTFSIGQSAPMNLINVVQTDDRITSAGVALGSIVGTLTTGSVGEDGQVRLTGALDPIPNNSIRVSLENIRLESPSTGVIRGDYEQVWSSVDFSGTARVFARIENLTRQSGGPVLTLRAPAEARTLTDFLQLVFQKR